MYLRQWICTCQRVAFQKQHNGKTFENCKQIYSLFKHQFNLNI